jgi:adenine-specific DNA-methyltransferase
MLEHHLTGNERTFLDLFAGTNVVGNYFKGRYTIYSNDILYFSFINAKAIIENNSILRFAGLKKIGIYDPFQFFNDAKNINPVSHYYEKSYTPSGGAMYLTVENGQRIDFIRDTIDEWKFENLITQSEYYYLVSSLIQSVPFVSNITGTYGAYLKKWDKRAFKVLTMQPLNVINNHRRNRAFNENANKLVKKLNADITYIDTPYNCRQYAANYHLLENIARNKKPILNGKTRIFDWTPLKSDFSVKKRALAAMEELIKNLNSQHVIISYSNEGIISFDSLISMLSKYSITGNVEVKALKYHKYESKLKPKNNNLSEYLIYFQRKVLQRKAKKKSIVIATWHPTFKASYIKSPLNYIGGKYKLLSQLIPLFPKSINTFVDLFSGGANVGINVSAKYYIFNDMNNRINEMFRYFAQHNADEIITSIKKRIKQYSLSMTNQNAFLRFREDYNQNPNPLDLYVLSSYSYNYQCRFNNKMEFNNPFGRNRSHFSKNMENNLRLFVNRLHMIDAVFTDKLFTDVDLNTLTDKDFVYLDPPYLITRGNYNDGNRGFQNWGIKQEKQLYQLMNRLTELHVPYALTNVLKHKGKSNDILKDYIQKHNVKVVTLRSSYKNSSYNTSALESNEVLVMNYEPADKKIQR